jgi:hypothetical protein
MLFYVVNDYAPGGEHVLRNQKVYNTLEDARDEARRRLGDLDDWRKWFAPDDDETVVEAYHASREIGCGGVQISKTFAAEIVFDKRLPYKGPGGASIEVVTALLHRDGRFEITYRQRRYARESDVNQYGPSRSRL